MHTGMDIVVCLCLYFLSQEARPAGPRPVNGLQVLLAVLQSLRESQPEQLM